MIKRQRELLIRYFVAGDILAIAVAFHLAFWLRFSANIITVPKGIPPYNQYLMIIPVLLVVQLIYFSNQGYYEIKLRRNRLDDLFLVLANSVVSAVLVLLIFSYLKSYNYVKFEVSHSFLFTYIPCALLSVFLFRVLIFRFCRQFFFKNGMSRVLIAGQTELGKMVAENLVHYRHFGIEICGFLGDQAGENVLGSYKDLEQVIKTHHITDLFIALSLRDYQDIITMIETANNLMVDIRLVPDILQIAALKSGMEHIEGIPIIDLGDIPLQGWHVFSKRALDFCCSLAGVTLLLPFWLIIALLIKLNSRGPVFYRQTRVGLDGRHFRMIKFRTMIHHAEKETGVIWSPKGDKRVTGVGRILRKFSLDETPQLINVLKGNMSLVGPRPERPEFVEQFKLDIPKYMLRHRVKTGMTGWAQVHGLRGNTPLDKRIEFDIYYIQNWTFRLDLEIIWRTLLKFQFVDQEGQNLKI